MAFKNNFFMAYLTQRLDAASVYLPVTDEARADLLHFIPDGDYTYATLANDTALETVVIRNDHGTLLLERGIEGTAAANHPPGTCVNTISPTLIAAIKDLVCNHKCCEE